jgi:hypothetical protein
VLNGVISDRSDTTCQIRGLFVRINVIPGSIFFILDINAALDIFENVSVLGYADDLKLFMTISASGIASCFKRV